MSVSHLSSKPLQSQLSEPIDRRAWRIHSLAVLLLLPIIACQVIAPAAQESNFGIKLADGELIIRDLAAHITFARAFWTEGAEYTVASHVQITNQWCGQEVNRALPFGYSPTMLWMLAPFCWLTTKWGFVVWTVLNSASVWWLAQRQRTVCLIGALILISPLTMLCLALGQTSLLTAVAIVFLMIRHRSIERSGGERWSWALAIDVLLLWALTAKPPLAAVAGAAMLVNRRWRTVMFAIALALVTTLALTPKLGFGWAAQYVALLMSYDRETAAAAFAWSLRPDHMSNLRSLLWSLGVVGDHAACQISTACWLIATAGIVVAGALRKLLRAAAWPLAVLAYLIFCPHLTSTEDLHLVVVLAWCVMYLPKSENSRRLALAVLTLAVVLLAPDNLLPIGTVRSALIFTIKFGIVGVMIAVARSCVEFRAENKNADSSRGYFVDAARVSG
jgi:hypothetical protein